MQDSQFYTVTAAGAFWLFAFVCGPIFPPEPEAKPEPAIVTPSPEPEPHIMQNWGTPSKAEIKARAARIACMQNPYCDTFGNIIKPERARPVINSTTTTIRIGGGGRHSRRH